MNKVVVIGADARKQMLKGINILADAVKATLGPRGRHVAIEREYGPPLITKDGVTVARQIFLSNNIQNMGAQLVKSVAAAANSQAGDGTTTATVLAQAIFMEGQLKVDEEGYNPVLLKRGIDLAVSKLVARMKGIAASITDEKSMSNVATISANNDAELGNLIAEAVAAVGDNGVVSVEEGAGGETSVYYTEGLKLGRGLTSEHFITNPERLIGEFEDCYIIPFNGKLNSIHEVLGLFEQIVDAGKPFLLVVKDIEVEALAHIINNKLRGNINGAVIKSPGFGDARRAVLEDLATLTGGKLFSDDDGFGLKDAKLSELGVARRVEAGKNYTVVLDGAASQEEVDAEVEKIKAQLKVSGLHDYQISVLNNRLSRLSGVAAIFRVGGASEAEMREKKDRVEDALNAVKSALQGGVVPGGGAGLIHASPVLDEIDTSDLIKEEVEGIEIVRRAIESPFRQILKNAGIEDSTSYIDKIKAADSPCGFDALKMEFVDNMFTSGIMDPTKVVCTALEHAGSASGTLLTTEVSIFAEKHEPNSNG